MSQKEFALRMDMSEKHISRLINGEVLLTYETARKIECVLGISAKFLNNLEAEYRQSIVLVNEENKISVDHSATESTPGAIAGIFAGALDIIPLLFNFLFSSNFCFAIFNNCINNVSRVFIFCIFFEKVNQLLTCVCINNHVSISSI